MKFRLSEEEATAVRTDVAKSGMNQQEYFYMRLFGNSGTDVLQKQQNIHDVYLYCKELFGSSLEVSADRLIIRNKEEQEFYELLFNFFMQKKQREIIDKGEC